MSVAKLLRVLLNAACVRGRKRLSRVVALLLISGVLLVCLRQAYRELSQQNEVSEGVHLLKNEDAPRDGEIMKKNVKERQESLDDQSNHQRLNILDQGGIVNRDIAGRHQDVGESQDKGYREKAIMEEERQAAVDANSKLSFDNLNEALDGENHENVNGYQDKDYGNLANDDGRYQDKENVGENPYDKDAVEGLEGEEVGREKEGDYQQDGEVDGMQEEEERGEEDNVDEEMAKLDMMEKNRNAMAPSRNGEGYPDGEDGGEEDGLPPAMGEGEEQGNDERGQDGEGEADVNGGEEDEGDKDEQKFVNEDAEAYEADVGEPGEANAGGADEADIGEPGEAGEADVGEPGKADEDKAALEEQRRMTAEEVAAAIRSGEMCKSVCPPFVWSDWSPCSKACGKGRRYRKAIYEFVCQSSDLCPLNRIEESVCETPCQFDPDKYGGPDGLDLYPINPLNPAIFPEDRNYMCGHWLVEYEKIHSEILEGKRPPSYLVYSTGKGEYPTAGGLSGRLKGITTVFFMAVLLERAFLIEWLDPTGLENYLVPKSFNWADLSPIQYMTRGKPHDIGSWKAAKENGKSSQWYMDADFSTYFKNPIEVIQGPRYDYTYALLRNPGLMPKAYELGIDRVKCRVCCAWDMLFKTVPTFEEEMKKLMRSLGHPARPVVAVQARVKSDDVQKSVTDVEHYLNCAQKGAKELKFQTPVYIPIINNRLVVHILQKKYFRIMKTPIEIETATRTVHTHLGNLPSDTEEEVVQGVQERTFKEFFLMLNSTLLVRAKGYLGSFANVADAIRRHYGKPGTVHTYTSGGSTCALFPDGSKIE